jgi:putative ubiquitin-RnfH superfamily antitoxin RatB of RatAB toxin-antitoxin module
VAELRVELVYAPAPGVIERVPLLLSAGATVRDAVLRSGLIERHPALQEGWERACSLFGRLVPPETPLADGDRLELTRPLIADPKAVRWRRARTSRDKNPEKRKAP